METTILENQMEKKMANEMETGIYIHFPSPPKAPVRRFPGDHSADSLLRVMGTEWGVHAYGVEL